MTDDRGEGRARRWAVRGVQVGLTVAVTWFILDRVGITGADVAELGDRWLRPDAAMLGVASAAFLVALLLSAAFWGRMVRELGGPRIPFLRAAMVYFASNLGRYIPGKVWQLAGLAYLARREGVSSATATAAAVLVQAVSLAGATVVGTWALASVPGVAGGWGPWAAGGIVLLVAVTTLPPVFDRLLGVWFSLARRLGSAGEEDSSGPDASPDDARAEDPGSGTRPAPDQPQGPEGAEDLVRGGRVRSPFFGLRWVALFGVNWILYAASFWLMARSFGIDAPFLALAPSFAAAYVLGYVMVFAPAGIGVREGFLVALLQPWVGGAAATALAVVARFWMTLLELLPALAFGSLHLLRGRRVDRP